MEKGKLTLWELKAMLHPTTGKKLPTPKYLRETDKLMVREELPDCVMEVYQSGFALYRTPGHYAVLRMEHVGTAGYESEQDDWASTVNVEDEKWPIGVMLCGEERIERKYMERAEERLVSTAGSGDDENGSDMEFDAGVDVLAEVVSKDEKDRMLSCLTGRQKAVVELYYFKGFSQPEIADLLGISIPVVCKKIKAAERAIRKNLKKIG